MSVQKAKQALGIENMVKVNGEMRPLNSSPVLRCKDCQELLFEAQEDGKQCSNCGSPELECDHPASEFDAKKGVSVCCFCGECVEDKGAKKAWLMGLSATE